MTVAVPNTLADALDSLAANPELVVVSGGTDLMVAVNFGHRKPPALLSLRRVDELRGWSVNDGVASVGAGTTCSMLETPAFAAISPALAQSARSVGSPQIRNAATIAGNLATASPAGDMVSALVALDAQVTIASSSVQRTIGISEVASGPKRNTLAPGELITAVSFNAATGPQEFMKVGPRNAMVIAVANVSLVVERSAGAAAARLALGSVGPTVVRAHGGEQWIRDNVDWSTAPTERAMAEFAQRVCDDASPIDDHRSTAAYRRHAVGVCARRALVRAMKAMAT